MPTEPAALQPTPMSRPMIPPGSTAPATVAPRSDGLRARSMQLGGIMLILAKKAAQMAGPGTEEEADFLKIATLLSKRYGAAQPDLAQQEVKLLGSQVSPQPAQSPEQMAAFQKAARDRLGTMGMAPGAAA